MKEIVFYHANCSDGFCSAFLWKKFRNPDAEFTPMHYGAELHNLGQYDSIVFLDFSTDRQLLEALAQTHELLVLDHHKTAKADLEGIKGCHFDVDECGASMTWQYLFPYPKEINAGIRSYPYDFEIWDALWETKLSALSLEGEAILRHTDTQVDMVSKHAQEVQLSPYIVKQVSCPLYQSEIGNKLALETKSGIGVVWYINSEGKYAVSLRSSGEIDVSGIAKAFNGGGHAGAAGFICLELPWSDIPLEEE